MLAPDFSFPPISVAYDRWDVRRARAEDLRAACDALVDEWKATATQDELTVLAQAIASGLTFPGVPAVARAQLANQGTRWSKDWLEVSACDPTTVCAVIKCANSATFFRGGPTHHLREAAERLGDAASVALGSSLATGVAYDARQPRLTGCSGLRFQNP